MSDLTNGGPVIIDKTIPLSFEFLRIPLNGTVNIKVYDNRGSCDAFIMDIIVKTNRGTITRRERLVGNETRVITVARWVNDFVITISNWKCSKEKLSFTAEVVYRESLRSNQVIINKTDFSGDRFNYDSFDEEIKSFFQEALSKA